MLGQNYGQVFDVTYLHRPCGIPREPLIKHTDHLFRSSEESERCELDDVVNQRVFQDQLQTLDGISMEKLNGVLSWMLGLNRCTFPAWGWGEILSTAT